MKTIHANKLASMIASEFHDDWRKTRLKEDGTFEPRWKEILDRNFIANLDKNNLPENVRYVGGEFEIDIANSSFDQLSKDWQQENFDAAMVCVDILYNPKEYATLDDIGEKIHSEWLKRNEWGRNDPVLSQPFAALPQNEQDKDMHQYYIAHAVSEKIRVQSADRER